MVSIKFGEPGIAHTIANIVRSRYRARGEGVRIQVKGNTVIVTGSVAKSIEAAAKSHGADCSRV
tara:strand:- start:1336 stop:1527 length:192 start_codon:yes stop_codon:yes gene_type:complete